MIQILSAFIVLVFLGWISFGKMSVGCGFVRLPNQLSTMCIRIFASASYFAVGFANRHRFEIKNEQRLSAAAFGNVFMEQAHRVAIDNCISCCNGMVDGMFV